MLHRKFNGQSIRINYSMNNIDDDVWVYLRRNILVEIQDRMPFPGEFEQMPVMGRINDW